MDTKPIFDYLHEIETRKSFVKTTSSTPTNEKLKRWQDYLHMLSDMKSEFEACVFQCVAENVQFKNELHVIANKLQRWITVYENRKRDMPQMVDDSVRVALTMAKDSLKFIQDNYGVKLESDVVQEPVVEKQEAKNEKKKVEAKSFMNLQEVTAYFGLPMNNIKDKQWRDRHRFPYMQPSGGRGKVVYIREDVEEWMRNNNK